MSFTTPPEFQGMNVVREFAATEDGVLHHYHDRVDGTEIYRLHRWCVADTGAFDPWNMDPRGVHCHRRGRKITRRQAMDLLAAEPRP